MSGITISDGTNTVDITKSTVQKHRTPRLSAMSPPNVQSDIIQTFGSEGFKLSVEGDWVTAPGGGDSDNRLIVESWRRANVLVEYKDGQLDSWFTIRSFVSHLIPGQPGAAGSQSTVIHYSLELTESLRATNMFEEIGIQIGIGGVDLPVEGTFSTWTLLWGPTNDTDVSGTQTDVFIDEINLQVWFAQTTFVKARNLSNGTITFAKNTNLTEPTSTSPIPTSALATIQKQYIVVRGIPGSSNNNRWSVMKNGTTLFSLGADLGNTVSNIFISVTGKYVCVIDSGQNIYIYSGS